MTDAARKHTQVKWWLTFYAAAFAAMLFGLLAVFSSDITELLIFLVGGLFFAVTGTLLIVFTARRKWPALLSFVLMLAAYGTVSFISLMNRQTIRTSGRWFLWSKSYKAELLRQPDSPNGDLRHMEWDGWGWAGLGDTVVYLVYDPQNSLSAAARSHAEGKFSGIPCAVPKVRRLESRWYSVVFYTDADWEHCV